MFHSLLILEWMNEWMNEWMLILVAWFTSCPMLATLSWSPSMSPLKMIRAFLYRKTKSGFTNKIRDNTTIHENVHTRNLLTRNKNNKRKILWNLMFVHSFSALIVTTFFSSTPFLQYAFGAEICKLNTYKCSSICLNQANFSLRMTE
jgi:hypothetical protein